jgi:UDP-2,3-diacylglucosamine pyrophosphatase LpxH
VITSIQSDRLAIISDLHLGNPFSNVRAKTAAFVDWASREGFDLCINGDGFEVTQVSFAKVSRDVPDVLRALKQAMRRGTKVYYVVGNHDIVFEHFLNDWGGFKLAPFLNVASGGRRFRVEHGHLYDPFFVLSPRLYGFVTWLGGFLLKVHPRLYKLWISFERLRSRIRGLRSKGIVGEHPSFLSAASAIEARGFDGVIFGHTHHTGSVILPDGGIYLNPGSFMLCSNYVKIEQGRMELCAWEERG